MNETMNETERELHTATLGPDEWWACSQPERPGEPFTCYDGHCPGCRLKLEVETHLHGDFFMEHVDNGASVGFRPASKCLALEDPDAIDGGPL